MYLNIDQLIGEQKKIIFGGKEYDVAEPTLEIALKAEKMLSGPDGADTESMAKFIEMMIPGLDIKKIPVRMFKRLFNYMMDDNLNNNEETEKNSAATVETPTE